MATDIEQRVVQMRFDNAQFEKGIKQSYESLDQFEKKLNMKGAAKGLEEVQRAANQVSLDNLVAQTDKVGGKFDAMAVIAISALNRITNSAITMGTNLVKSLSLDQVSSGFSKYEAKVASVQTLVNATGRSVEDIEGYMQKLMWFSDETSYNFSDMSRALGTMVSSGGDIDRLVPLITGFANSVSFVGKGATEFSRAMIQLTQGYGRNALMLEDWKSIEQTLGGAKQLKEVFIQVGEELGKIRQGELDIGTFNESLRDKWLDQQVMEEALGRWGQMTEEAYKMIDEGIVDNASEAYEILSETYDDYRIRAAKAAQEAKSFSEAIDATKDAVSSGWMASFDIIFGNYEEAVELWTGLTNILWDVFASSAEARNEMLQEWKDEGGRTAAIEAITVAFENLWSVVTVVKEAFRDVFPPMTGKRLAELTKAVNEFFKELTPSEEALNSIRVAFKGLLLPVKLVVTAIKIAIVAFAELVKAGAKFVDKIIAWPSKFATVEEALKDLFGDERGHRLAEALTKIVERLTGAFTKLTTATDGASESFASKAFRNILSVFNALVDILKTIGGGLLDGVIFGLEFLANLDFSSFTNFFKSIGTYISQFVRDLDFSSPIEFCKSLWKVAGDLVDKLKQLASGLDLVAWAAQFGPVGENLTGIFEGLAGAIQQLIGKLTPAKILVFGFGVSLVAVFFNLSKAIEVFTKVAEGLAGVIGGINGLIKAVTQRIKGSKIIQAAILIATLAGAMLLLSKIPADQLLAVAGSLAIVMGALLAFSAGMAVVNEQLVKTPRAAKNLTIISGALMAVGASALLLAGALKILESVDIAGIGWKIVALLAVVGGMVGAAVLLGKYAKEMDKTAVYLLGAAVSVLLLSKALEKISQVDLSESAPNLVILIAALWALSKVAKSMGRVKFGSMAGMTLFVLNIIAFAEVLSLLRRFDTSKLLNGIINLIPIFSALVLLGIAIRIAGGQSAKMGSQLMLMSAGILILSYAIERIGGMDQGMVERGSAVVGQILVLFAGIIAISAIAKNGAKVAGTSFILMSAAILILAMAIENIGNLDKKTAIQGTVVVGILLVLFGVINATGNAANGAKSSIIAMSVCLGLLVAALALLTLLDFKELMGRALVLGSVMLAFGAMLKSASKLKMTAAISSILMLITVVSMLGLAFKYLEDINPESVLATASGIGIVLVALNLSFDKVKSRTGKTENLLKAVFAMGILLGEVALVFGLLQNFGQGEQPIKNAISVGILLETLTHSFGKMSVKTGDYKNLWNSMGAMGVMLAEVGLIFGLLQNFGQGEQPIRNATAVGIMLETLADSFSRLRVKSGKPGNLRGTIIAMGGMLLEVGVIFGLLQNFGQGEQPIQNAIALGIILEALALASRITQGIKPPENIIATLGTMAGMLIEAGIMVALLNQMPLQEGLITKVTALSILLLAMSAVIAIISSVGLGLSMLGTVAGQAIIGVTAALAMVAEIAVFIAAMGQAFTEIDFLRDGLDKAQEVFPKIGSVLGGFFGGVISGFLESGIGQSVENFGTNLSNFATNAETFFNLEVNPGLVDSIGRLASVMLMLTANDFLEAINIFSSGNSLESFGEDLAAFAPHIATFASVLDGINATNVTAGAALMEGIASVLTAIPTEGGLLNMIFGDKKLDSFGEGLEDIAEGVKKYAKTLNDAGITEETLAASTRVASILTELNDVIPKSGGLVDFFGRPNLKTFGSELKSFATDLINALKVFQDEALDENVAKKARDVGNILAELTKSIPASGDLIDFFGRPNLETFGTELIGFAGGLRGFFETLDGVNINEATAEAAKTAGSAMAELAKSVPLSGPLVDFLGTKNLGTFGDQIGYFGEGVGKFFKAITGSGITDAGIEMAKDAGLAFVEIAEKLSPNTGIVSAWSGTDLGKFGTTVEKLGTSIATYFDSVKEVTWSTVSDSLTQLSRFVGLSSSLKNVETNNASKLKSFLVELAKAGVDNFTTSFSEMEERISQSVSTTIGSAIQGAKGNLMTNTSGYGFVVDAIVAGIDARLELLTAKAVSIVAALKQAVVDQQASIEGIGETMIWAIATAFERDVTKLNDAVKRVMESVVAQAKFTLGIVGSSSQAFERIGQYCINGYINGFDKNASRLYAKVRGAGDRVVKTFSDATGVNSPSVKFAEIAKFSVLGYVLGIEKNTRLGENAMVKMGANLLQSIKDFFEIHSPSRVTRDEVGRYIMEGIAEGITEDMSAEDAAAQKAQNIVHAFQSEFDKLSTSIETADLENQLWAALNPNASDAEVQAHERELLDKKLENQASRVVTAEAQYKATLQALGENAEETKQMYNTYLKEKISFAQLASQMLEGVNEDTRTNAEAFGEYARLLRESYDDLKSMGFGDEEIKEWAKKESGWNPDLKPGQSGNSIEEIMQRYKELVMNGAEDIEVVIVPPVEKAVEQSVTTAGNGGLRTGQTYVQGVSQGINGGGGGGTPGIKQVIKDGLEGAINEAGSNLPGQVEQWIDGAGSAIDQGAGWLIDKITGKSANMSHAMAGDETYVEAGRNCVNELTRGLTDAAATTQSYNAMTSLSETLLNTADSYTPQYQNVGSQMMTGLANGIASGGSSVINAATSVARQALVATEQILGIHSPSREYYRIGKMIDQGLSNGILDNYGIVKGSLVALTDNMSDVDMTLRPLVDISGIETATLATSRLNDELSMSKELQDAWAATIRFDANGNVIPEGYANSSGVQGSYITIDPETKKAIMKMIYDTEYLENAHEIEGAGKYKDDKLNDILEDLLMASWKGDGPTEEKADRRYNLTLTQNNYSPTALNTSDLARQTKTALNRFKNEVGEYINRYSGVFDKSKWEKYSQKSSQMGSKNNN